MRARVATAAEAEFVDIFGVAHCVRVASGDSDRTICLTEIVAPPGTGIPRHIHTREEETFHVLEGEFEFEVDGRTVRALVGTTVFAPRNVPHGFRNAGNRPARLFVAITPGGLGEMFDELAKLPAGPPDLARVGEICGRYGVRFA
jgi:quercetin dioxygenase-like cupin family protein